MKTKIYLSVILIAFCFSCRGKTNMNTPLETPIETVSPNTTQGDSDGKVFADLDIESTNEESLNDIRFRSWTDKDWIDNDYLRFLRKCFDDCYNGIENENTSLLQDYKPLLNNQFFVYKVEPFIMGGLFITLGFLNDPKILYETAVYSDVDENTKAITGYSLPFGLGESTLTSSFSKEQLLEVLRKNPENKLW